jgi:hypothetical protein
VELIKTHIVTRQVTSLLSDEAYSRFQVRLAANPALGALIKGGGGVRKVRLAIGPRGKSAGARIIYYWAVGRSTILLLYAYSKNVSPDLTPAQISQLARAVKKEFRYEGKDV